MKNEKKKRKIQFEIIGLTIIDPKTKKITVKELKIAKKRKKRFSKC